MSDQPKQTLTLRVSPELHAWIVSQARANLRSSGSQAAWLLRSLMDADGPTHSAEVINIEAGRSPIPEVIDYARRFSVPDGLGVFASDGAA